MPALRCPSAFHDRGGLDPVTRVKANRAYFFRKRKKA